MDNKEIAAVFYELAVYKELLGENAFKVRAYQNAARTIETYPESFCELAANEKLEGIRGIGKSISESIGEIVREGKLAELEDIKQAVPPGIPELLELHGVGPKKVVAVWKELGITSLPELENACREGLVSSLAGFGEKSQKKILEAIEFKKKSRGSFLYVEAYAIADAIIRNLERSGLFPEIALAGSLRRGKKLVNDADILLVPGKKTDEETVKKTLVSLADSDNGKRDVIGAGPTKVSIRVSGLQVDFRIIQKESFPAGLQYFTGSKIHNTILRGRAKDAGYKLNEYGIYKDEVEVSVRNEEEIYRVLGCSYIQPELREGQGEIDAASNGTLPVLVEAKDVKGIIHVHSSFSDGRITLEELARTCAESGYEYLGITDHSQSARYAGGLYPERLEAQAAEIRRLNAELAPFRIFFGIESDIRTDGSLDYDDSVLSMFDFIVGSIHMKLTMDKKEATERLVKAISNPYITVLGHVSGRVLLQREGYPYDEDAVLASLSEHGVALEHNCNPYRLDPDWETLRKAARLGILVSLDPDAHDGEGIGDVKLGVLMARKAWLSKGDILNCKSREEIHEYFKERKRRKGA